MKEGAHFGVNDFTDGRLWELIPQNVMAWLDPAMTGAMAAHREPKIALPTRTCVAPSWIAAS